MKSILTLLGICALLVTTPLLALDVDTLRADGLAAETTSGYLQAKPGLSDDITAYVADINNKRRANYLEISRKNGQTLDVVEKLAGKKLIERAAPGEYVVDSHGQWIKK